MSAPQGKTVSADTPYWRGRDQADVGDEREGPDEVFTLGTEILAVDGPTAVVRAEVCYGDPPRQEYRDLWVIQLACDGRCTRFEEWPYWPGHPHSAPDDPA